MALALSRGWFQLKPAILRHDCHRVHLTGLGLPKIPGLVTPKPNLGLPHTPRHTPTIESRVLRGSQNTKLGLKAVRAWIVYGLVLSRAFGQKIGWVIPKKQSHQALHP